MTIDEMQGHTPGPWEVRESEGSFGGRDFYVIGGGTYIAQVEGTRAPPRHRFTAPGDAAEANALVLAAAPQMLEVLRELLAIVQHGDAPAYGSLPQVDLASRWYVTLASAVDNLAAAAIAKATTR